MNQRCALCTLPGEVARLKADNQILTRDLTKLMAKIDRATNEMRTVVKALSIEVVQFEQRFVQLLKESRAGSATGHRPPVGNRPRRTVRAASRRQTRVH